MTITNDSELMKSVKQAGILLQEIHNYCEKQDKTWANLPQARIRFPRGFIRRAKVQRERLQFLSNDSLKDNLAYTLILSDVVLWLKLRTDIWGVPKKMVTKLYVFLIGTLCESITKEYLSGACGKNFKERNKYLLKFEIIDQDTKDNLDWIWDIRNKMHLFQIERREYENEYNDACHQRTVDTFRQLLKALSQNKN